MMKKLRLILILLFIINLNLLARDSTLNVANYDNISAEISTILGKYNLKSTNFGLAVYSTKLNKWIYQNNSQKLLVPASNTKLVTTFTTLSLLEKKQLIETQVVTDGKIIDGILKGDIYIIGGGDALLSISDLEIIADNLRRLGIIKIEGNICGDDSFFDSTYDRFRYSGDRDEVEPTAPVSALSFEKNVVNIIVTSGKVLGKTVSVSFKPASSGFKYVNFAIVKGSKSKRTLTVSTSTNSQGEQVFYIRGNLPANRTYSYKHFIKDPAFIVASALKDRLISGGIAVSGFALKKTFSGTAETNILYTHINNAENIINIVNKRSDNYLAENLFKLNGALFSKRIDLITENMPQSTDNSTAKLASTVELQTLENNNIDTKGFILNDGSGLSRRNFVTASGLASLLINAQGKPFADTFFASLSIAGIDGTLAKRMIGTKAMGNVFAKTGSLRNVSSLAGIIQTQSGDTLCFSFIFNGGSVGIYKEIENLICINLAEK